MNNKAEIKCDNAKLVYTNRIICYNNREISLDIQLTEKHEDILKLKFIFEYPEDDKINMEVTSNKNGVIVFKLMNFKNPFGTGLKKPLQIARLNDEYIYILFNINKADNANPVLDISIYVSEDDD